MVVQCAKGDWELRWQQLGRERRGWRGKERVAETRQVGDGDVLILNVSCYVSGTQYYNAFPLIFQRGEGQCGSAL
jgi:hypothetical protein